MTILPPFGTLDSDAYWKVTAALLMSSSFQTGGRGYLDGRGFKLKKALLAVCPLTVT
jgi:hypothetical protein